MSLSPEDLNQLVEALVPVVANAVAVYNAEEAKRRKAQRAPLAEASESPVSYQRFTCACGDPGCNCSVVYSKRDKSNPPLRPGLKLEKPAPVAPARDPRLRLEKLPYSRIVPGRYRVKLAPLPTGARHTQKVSSVSMAQRVAYSKEASRAVMAARELGVRVPFEDLLSDVYEAHGLKLKG